MKKTNWLSKKSNQMTLIASALILHCTAALVACSNPGSPGSGVVGASIAGAPGAACFQTSNYSGRNWYPYQQLGAQPYGDGAPTSSGLCSCSPGYIPACGANVGMMCVPTQVISQWNYQPALYTFAGGHEFRFNAFVRYGTAAWNNHFNGRVVEHPRGGMVAPRGHERPIRRRVAQTEVSSLDAVSSIQDSTALAYYGSYGGSCTTQMAQTCIVGQQQCGYGRCHSVTGIESAGQAGICGQ